MQESIYYVDKYDRATGEISEKLSAHNSNAKLHAAFSCYIFNKNSEFLVTQRAHSKKVWPSVWTNSCCGHPMPGESREDAVARRLMDELVMTADIASCVVTEYIYKTPPYSGIVEDEYCPIYLAVTASEPKPNREEVVDFEWLPWEEYRRRCLADSNDYSFFAKSAPDILTNQMPKWSWWAKDQLKLLDKSTDFQQFIRP